MRGIRVLARNVPTHFIFIKRGEIMNLDFVRNDFRFNARTSAVIYNKDLSKVLLFFVILTILMNYGLKFIIQLKIMAIL